MKLAIFASGGGSNFQAIVDAAESGALRADVVLCVTNNKHAGVLDRATSHGIPVAILDPTLFEDEALYADELLAVLRNHGVDFIALAGYMRMIPPIIVRTYSGRMVNIHPALLPAYGGKGMYGKRVHQAVLADGADVSGATIHLVDEEYDTGPIILQRSIRVEPDDTPESLAARVLEIEHQLYPKALALFADDRITVSGRRITLKD